MIKHHVRIVCAVLLLGILGFRYSRYDQPLDWYGEIIALVAIILSGLFLAWLIWFVFIRERKVKIRSTKTKYQLQYYCPACQHAWDEDHLPADGVCPRDGMRLKTFDPVEDRNTHLL